MKAGATSQSIYFEVLDSTSTTGGRKTGLAYNTASLVAYYVRAGGSATAITLATLAAANSAWSSGGFKEVDATNMPGVYRLDVPDAAIAAGVPSVVVVIKGATGMVQASKEILLEAVDFQDAVRMGLTALPNAAAGASGGLPLSADASGRVDVGKVGGTVQTARDLGASVLIESGTGTGQLDVSSGVIKADAVKISGDATAADNLEAMLDGTGGVTVYLEGLSIQAEEGSNNSAVVIAGDGTGAGLRVIGETGHGAHFVSSEGSGIYSEGLLKGSWGAYFKGGGTGPGPTPLQGGFGIEGVSDESAAMWLINQYDSMSVMQQLDRYGMITTGTLSITVPFNAPTGEIKFIRGDIYTTALGRQVAITINGGPNPTGLQCYMYYKPSGTTITSKAVTAISSFGADWTYTFDFTDEETAAISASSTPFEVKVWTATNDDPITILTGTITMTAPVYDGTGGAVAP